MELESKILSKEILQYLYAGGKTLGTAESCTGGGIAQAIIAVPGASNYFKGGIISYSDDVKEHLLNVKAQLIQEQTSVSQSVAESMVIGACETLNCDYAISTTGIAGPGGGCAQIPVGTIWIGYGSKDDVRTVKIDGDNGRDINLIKAINIALRLFLDYYKEKNSRTEEDDSNEMK